MSDTVSLVLVYVDPSDTQIRWLTAADADKWNKTRADLMVATQDNMDRILRQTKIETAPIEEYQLGMLSDELSAQLASHQIEFVRLLHLEACLDSRRGGCGRCIRRPDGISSTKFEPQ